MSDNQTTNYEFELVTDNDYIKHAIRDKNNANLEAVDETLNEFEANVPSELTDFDVYQITYRSTAVTIIYWNDNTQVSSQKLAFLKPLDPPTVTRDGRMFVGWNTENNGTGTWYQAGDTPDYSQETLNLYAIFEFVLTLNANNGQEIVPTTTLSGIEITLPEYEFEAPEGLNFLCWGKWDTQQNNAPVIDDVGTYSGTARFPGDAITLTEDLTLYACFDNLAIIYIKSKKDTNVIDVYGIPVPTEEEVVCGIQVASLNYRGFMWNFERNYKLTGHTHVGYSTAINGGGLYIHATTCPSDIVYGGGEATVYDHMHDITSNILFDASGGLMQNNQPTYMLNCLWTLTMSTVLSNIYTYYTGYKFLYWVDIDGLEINPQLTVGQALHGDDTASNTEVALTLFAEWEPAEVTLKFNFTVDRGTPSWTNTSSFKTSYYKFGDQVYLSSDIPERTGYRFLAWGYTKYIDSAIDISNFKLDDVSKFSGDETNGFKLTLIPISIILRRIKCMPNGASGEAYYTDYVDNGSVGVVPECTFTYEGHVFDHWNTAAAGTGTSYQPGDELMLTSSPTIYAIWQEIASE